MNIKRFFVIAFNDLKDEKQADIIKSLKQDFRETLTKQEVMELCGADPFDLDRADVDRMDEILDRVGTQAQWAWCELPVFIDLRKNFRRGQ
jgi:hypothetical protein